MPMNHFPQNLPETIWWTQLTSPQSQPLMEAPPNNNTLYSKHRTRNSYRSQHYSFPTRNFNLNQDREDDDDKDEEEVAPEEELVEEEDEEEEVILGSERQPMFEKPLTPSDVGKLNRLVIPKQHAEKYFPLGGDSGEKGLLLSFEDECGKCWRFRYSYWNSSQSYVLTKGWSRFVKDKRLDAGDVVLFQRDPSEADRFFIGWRRRAAPPAHGSPTPAAAAGPHPHVAATANHSNPSLGWTRVFYSAHPYPSHPYPSHPHAPPPPLPYQPDCLHAGSVGGKKQTPAAGNSKRLRLFGVNLECQMDEESSSEQPSTPDGGSSLSGPPPPPTLVHPQYNYHHHQSYSYNNNSSSYMDINFSRDVNQMRDHRG